MDKTKFCGFHHEHGHDTEDCRHLRGLVKKFVHAKKLDKYVKTIRADKSSSVARASDSTQPEVKVVISAIHTRASQGREAC